MDQVVNYCTFTHLVFECFWDNLEKFQKWIAGFFCLHNLRAISIQFFNCVRNDEVSNTYLPRLWYFFQNMYTSGLFCGLWFSVKFSWMVRVCTDWPAMKYGMLTRAPLHICTSGMFGLGSRPAPTVEILDESNENMDCFFFGFYTWKLTVMKTDSNHRPTSK